jgi:hypothetical protein
MKFKLFYFFILLPSFGVILTLVFVTFDSFSLYMAVYFLPAMLFLNLVLIIFKEPSLNSSPLCIVPYFSCIRCKYGVT